MLYLLEDCENCVNLEAHDEPICFASRNYTFIRELEILDEIYEIEEPVIVTFVPYLEKPDGTKAKGNYGLAQFATREGKALLHMIVLDSDLDLIEAATILIHEYAHVLSQQNHDFVMYELWREYLRSEFVKRWEGESTCMDRVILIGDREEEDAERG
jgi:hypothetical protein